jgi:hypothetical protein
MEVHHGNRIQLSLANSYRQDYPIVQYADATLVIMQAEAKQLFVFKCLLQSFASSTGLKVNFNKSYIVPINVDEEKPKILASTLGCMIESMSFTIEVVL